MRLRRSRVGLAVTRTSPFPLHRRLKYCWKIVGQTIRERCANYVASTCLHGSWDRGELTAHIGVIPEMTIHACHPSATCNRLVACSHTSTGRAFLPPNQRSVTGMATRAKKGRRIFPRGQNFNYITLLNKDQ